MKIFLQIILAVVLFHSNAFSQSAIAWQNTYGGTGDDTARSIIQTADGGYIIVGNTDSNDFDVLFSHGDTDGWLVKDY